MIFSDDQQTEMNKALAGLRRINISENRSKEMRVLRKLIDSLSWLYNQNRLKVARGQIR